MMTFEECVAANYFDPVSWIIFMTSILMMIVLIKLKWTRTGIAICIFGLCLGAIWMYLGYELNCVELWTG